MATPNLLLHALGGLWIVGEREHRRLLEISRVPPVEVVLHSDEEHR